MNFDGIVNEIVGHFGKYAKFLSCQELNETTDTSFMSVCE